MTSNVKYHFANISGLLSQSAIELMTEKLEQALKKSNEIMPIEYIDVVIFQDKVSAIPNFGLGGYSLNKNAMTLYLNPNEFQVTEEYLFKLQRLFIHELHHCARYRTTGFGETLSQQVITEGMADHYSLEVLGGDPYPWSTAINANDMQKWENLFFENKDKTGLYEKWFYGRGSEIPKWIGYSLGFHFVKEYLEMSSTKVSSINNMSDSEIIRAAVSEKI